MRRIRSIGVLGLLWACQTPDGATTTDSDTVAGTDSTAPTDIVVHSDTDASVDTELVPTDTDPIVVPTDPPSAWGDGFVDVTGAILTTDVFPVDPGNQTMSRSPENLVTFWADFNADGHDDLYHGTITPHVGRMWPFEGRVYSWNLGSLEALTGIDLSPTSTDSFPISATDLDGDGWVDIVYTGANRTLRWGTGPLTWTDEVPIEGELGYEPRSMAIGWFDVDQDGWVDMLSSHDCTRTLMVAQRIAPQRFVWNAGLSSPLPNGTRNVTILSGFLEDDRPMHYIVSDKCGADKPGFFRPNAAQPGEPTRLDPIDLVEPLAFWDFMPQFQDEHLNALAPMGAGLHDLDQDGLLDLTVTSGLTPQVVLRGTPQHTFADGSVPSLDRPSGPFGQPEFPWGVDFPDLDMDGRPDILFSIGDDATSFMALRGHRMAAAAYWNRGGLDFVDVSDAVGLSLLGNWRALALGDPDHDGDADVAIGGAGQLSRVYRNDIETGNHGLSIKLRGYADPQAGLGARVELHQAGLPVQTGMMGALAEPYGRTAPILFFGLGQSTEAERIRITWPTGYIQEVTGLAAGMLHVIDEPATVDVVPSTRRAFADGSSVLTVQAWPRSLDGSIDTQATVAFHLIGEGSMGTPVAHPDGHYTVEVQAPEAAGESRVRVTINGVPLRVAPRLWWDAVVP